MGRKPGFSQWPTAINLQTKRGSMPNPIEQSIAQTLNDYKAGKKTIREAVVEITELMEMIK